MRRISALLTFMAVLAMAAPMALAQGGAVYMSPRIMLSFQNVDSKGYDLGRYDPDYRRFMNGDKDKAVFGGGLAAGYDFGIHYNTPIRLEAEFLGRTEAKADFSDSMLGMTARGDVKLWTQTLFLNAYYDIPSENIWHPYVGVGLGLAHHDARTTTKLTGVNPVITSMRPQDTRTFTDRSSAWNFAYNLGAGISYPLDTGIDLDIGYRYSDFGDVTLKMINTQTGVRLNNEVDSTAHEILFGLRFTGF